MTTPPSDLRKVHMLLTYILSEFDRVCGQIGVDYALYGGSAIGAVRHGGFIPWDDDIDVFMLRPDYERFLREAPAHLSEGFRIDNQTSVPRYGACGRQAFPLHVPQNLVVGPPAVPLGHSDPRFARHGGMEAVTHSHGDTECQPRTAHRADIATRTVRAVGEGGAQRRRRSNGHLCRFHDA